MLNYSFCLQIHHKKFNHVMLKVLEQLRYIIDVAFILASWKVPRKEK
ncbi:hypothetical protein Godav_028830 [Gossypium davidsonii]|uniref:Uncharacterized protein n=1 Tax=Gossypium davidsonii TaxID=34287 RepID=A0A7J8THS1_GOSDV|nr:hypothetical protein [Gossypium davidsonii]